MRISTSSPVLQRRSLLNGLVGAALWPATSWAQGAHVRPLIEVWKSPTCSWCNDWIARLKANGLRVKSYDTGNAPMRAELGVPPKTGSCHTAKIEDYAIEGHVPAREIHRLLKEQPTAIGLSVPGMPLGSPGIDGEALDHKTEPHNVLPVLRDGATRVFQAY